MPITKNRIDEIEAIAQTILDSTFKGDVKLPVQIRDIVKEEGLTLKIGRFTNSEIIGSYNRSTKTIEVSDSETYQRTSFTIAHELGHYILHSNKSAETFYRADTYLQGLQDGDEETEANCFAAALLMPKDKVKRFRVWFDGSSGIEKLAALFGVSAIAMNYRLKNMRLA